jgi:hypothetical protein
MSMPRQNDTGPLSLWLIYGDGLFHQGQLF